MSRYLRAWVYGQAVYERKVDGRLLGTDFSIPACMHACDVLCHSKHVGLCLSIFPVSEFDLASSVETTVDLENLRKNLGCLN
jgi:hypothetical protein